MNTNVLPVGGRGILARTVPLLIGTPALAQGIGGVQLIEVSGSPYYLFAALLMLAGAVFERESLKHPRDICAWPQLRSRRYWAAWRVRCRPAGHSRHGHS